MWSGMKCALCEDKQCYDGKNCLKKEIGEIGEIGEINSEDKRIMEISAKIEAEGYMKITRMEELVRFCKEMKFKKLGIAFCIGLENEAKILHKYFSKNFDVFSVCCKIGGIDKENFGLEKRGNGFEAMCNPIGQAKVLNKNKTDLNIILGLCIGHDILFAKYSEAPVTVLAVKDRVLAHNPLSAIYSGYYRRRWNL
jgi:uncharacterized metal-binding protein